MNSSSAYHPHHHHLPPFFIDHHQPQLSDLLLGLPHVPSVGSQQAPLSTLISRNGPPSSCLLNARLPARKDRHRKILTAQGLRDRRVRLSIGIARRFFDLQDMLGFDKASKTLEWLLRKSTDSINKLAMTKHIDTSHDKDRSSPGNNSSDSGSSCNSSSFASLSCEAVSRKGKQKKARLVSSVSGEKMKEIADDVLERDQSRVRARARARERTREKFINNCPIMALSAQVEGDARNLLAPQIHNDNAAMKHRALRSDEFGIMKQSMVTGRKPGSTSGRHHENLATALSKDGNNFNNLECFFPSLHPQPQWDINGAINLNLSTRDPRSMDDLEKLIAPSVLKRTNGTP